MEERREEKREVKEQRAEKEKREEKEKATEKEKVTEKETEITDHKQVQGTDQQSVAIIV